MCASACPASLYPSTRGFSVTLNYDLHSTIRFPNPKLLWWRCRSLEVGVTKRRRWSGAGGNPISNRLTLYDRQAKPVVAAPPRSIDCSRGQFLERLPFLMTSRSWSGRIPYASRSVLQRRVGDSPSCYGQSANLVSSFSSFARVFPLALPHRDLAHYNSILRYVLVNHRVRTESRPVANHDRPK